MREVLQEMYRLIEQHGIQPNISVLGQVPNCFVGYAVNVEGRAFSDVAKYLHPFVTPCPLWDTMDLTRRGYINTPEGKAKALAAITAAIAALPSEHEANYNAAVKWADSLETDEEQPAF